MKFHRTASAVAVALACAVIPPSAARASITLANIDFWVGPAPGPAVHHAVLVIDFAYPGAPTSAPSLAWGYRWPAAESRTGHDMLGAIIAADPRLDVTGLEFGFIDTLTYDADLDGRPDYSHPGFDPVTSSYSNYWVNNAVIDGTPPNFDNASHILSPNGNPYADIAPGKWIFSSTGVAGRPLADGSWDGWIYASEPAHGPRLPVAALIPEPAPAAFLLLAAMAGWLRRHQKSRHDSSPAADPSGIRQDD